MRYRRISATLAAVTALGLAAPATAAAAQESAPGERSLATVLAADGQRFDRNSRDFDILERAVVTVLGAKPNSAVGVLADGSKALTAFAPTDMAFKRLAYQLTGRWPATERKAFRSIARAAGVDVVETVLLYHVVPGATITYRQALKADGVKLDTAAGSAVTVRVPHHHVWLGDADKNDRNARVIRKLANINKGNLQIAHGVDRVLRPVDLP